jgi:hypothetical protein
VAHKVFVSYKYNDAHDTRDKIIRALGSDSSYYKGERGFKPLNVADSTLKQYLADMIYDTSVTVVVISPNVKQSNWVDWEIQYSLESHTRNGRTSGRNGIVCVIQAQIDYSSPKPYSSIYGQQYNRNSYWAYGLYNGGKDFKKTVFPDLIIKNMKESFVSGSDYYSGYLGVEESNLNHAKDYCIVVAETTFLTNPSKYIDEAFKRAYDSSFTTETRDSSTRYW